jgi:hypothetical protein
VKIIDENNQTDLERHNRLVPRPRLHRHHALLHQRRRGFHNNRSHGLRDAGHRGFGRVDAGAVFAEPILVEEKKMWHKTAAGISAAKWLLCNLPVFIFLLSLINRKMVLTEALGFIAPFAIIGAVFGLGFTWVQGEAK